MRLKELWFDLLHSLTAQQREPEIERCALHRTILDADPIRGLICGQCATPN